VGNTSVASGTLGLIIDTQIAAPSTPDLITADDTFGAGTTGTNTDNITSKPKPTFSGTAEANSTVTLFSDNVQVGTGTATGGTWNIAPISDLSDGPHNITAKALDAAGNLSTLSGTLGIV